MLSLLLLLLLLLFTKIKHSSASKRSSNLISWSQNQVWILAIGFLKKKKELWLRLQGGAAGLLETTWWVDK
jgi:hypothetical protein